MMQSLGMEVQLFDYLEKHAPLQDQQAGYDIADYLLQIKKTNECAERPHSAKSQPPTSDR